MSGRSVVRLSCGVFLSRAMFCGALVAAVLIVAPAANAQQPEAPKSDAPKSGDKPANAGAAPATAPAPASAPDLKTTFGRAPKDIPLVDPCKSPHPPSYCNVKD